VQRDCTPLRETGEHDALRGCPALDFAVDELRDGRRARPNSGIVLARSAVEPQNVVPSAHRHAAIDRHSSQRRVRKHEAHGEIQPQLGHDRLEIVAVGT
jgi:hypothetical protein